MDARPALKVAVITPYYKETRAILEHCHDSVKAQTYPTTHYMVADGFPQEIVSLWQAEHIILPKAHGDNGNTPRAIGSLSAINQGFDAIAYLDADNWFQADHIEQMVALHYEQRADICTCNRTMHRLDGSLMYHDIENDGKAFVDTSNMVLFKPAFRMVALWALMPKPLSPLCDRIFWQAVCASGIRRAHRRHASVAFRTRYADHYHFCGELPPEGAVTTHHFSEPLRWWQSQSDSFRQSWSAYFASGDWR